MTDAGAVPVSERDVVSYVRSRRKQHDRRRASDRLINAYMGLIVAFYVMLAISNVVDTDVALDPGRFLDLLVWLPLVLFGVVWGVLRFATWQGPVLFSSAELQWLLSAPLSRRRLVLLRLRRVFAIAAISGTVAGVAFAAMAAVTMGDGLVGEFVVASVGFAALSLMATALSWHVERSNRWGRLVTRMSPLALLLALLIGLGGLAGNDAVLMWSGPWGWAAGPAAAEAGRPVALWGIQLGLLSLAAAAAIFSAVATADGASEEELWRRAEARSSAAAALFFGDLRTLKSVARRGRTRGRVHARASHLRRVRQPWLAIAVRDLLALRRNPGAAGRAGIYTGAGFAAAIAAVDRPILAVVAFVALYAAASRLLEPIRIEAEQPGAHHVLPWPWGTVLVMHCLLPVIVLTFFGWIGLAVVGLAGFVEPIVVAPLLLVAPFAAAALVTAGAISAARRPFPIELLISQEERGVFVLAIWLLAGPVLAALVVNIAFGSMRSTLDQGITGETAGAAMFLGLATAAFSSWLWTRKVPD